MDAPTCKQLMNEELETVLRTSDDSWRHGSYITEVFFRDTDSTYWEAYYRRSGDGETNELREGSATITRVYPEQVTTTIYVASPK